MFIRSTQTRNANSGECYFTYRLVRSERVAGKVRQLTLLNLGRHFPVERAHWPNLCARIEELLGGQAPLLPLDCPDEVERHAQRIAAQLLARQAERPAAPARGGEAPPAGDVQSLDVDSLALVRPRSVGVEQAALWAMAQVDFTGLLRSLGFSGPQRAAALGQVVGRMAAPGSELATYDWLVERSGLGELLDVDFEAMGLPRLYRVADRLLKSKERIESTLFGRLSDLFALETTVTLYDLTNTYFEGELAGNAKARRGRSKEKRRDCPLLTLALVLDGSGFVQRSEVFAGNAVESRTLAEMLTGLAAPAGALVVMDRGIATQANLEWLRAQGYRYLVVSRERNRHFDPAQAQHIETAQGDTLHLHKSLSEDGQEVRLHCWSERRAHKETAIQQRFAERFEQGLEKIATGLGKPRTVKRLEIIWERIGRLKRDSRGAGQHYRIEVEADAAGQRAVALRWQREPVANTAATDPGVYCLRSSETDWDAERLWRTYILLTDLEAVFRSLKSELGLRPIYHRTEARAEAHLFITVLAYQFVQILRRRLAAQGNHASWHSLRLWLGGQVRVTAVFERPDGRTLHVRKATRPEGKHLTICQGLGIETCPGGVQKLIH